MENILAAEDKMKNRMEGFNFSVKSAAGTVQTTLAQAFDLVLEKLTKLANKFNDMADMGAKYLADHASALLVGYAQCWISGSVDSKKGVRMSELSQGWQDAITIFLVICILFLTLRDPVANTIEKTFSSLWSGFKVALTIAIIIFVAGGILGAIVGVIRFGWKLLLP